MVRNQNSEIRPTVKLNASELLYGANFTVFIANSKSERLKKAVNLRHDWTLAVFEEARCESCYEIYYEI